jgi:ribosomal protein S18 acetylase RimI-like enzyme
VASRPPYVCTLHADEWSTLRAIRLQALRESPDAFLSDYDRENRWGEPEWRRAVLDAEWFVAFHGDEPAGLAGVVQAFSKDVEPHIVSMWVHPSCRRAGIARRLIDVVMHAKTAPGIQLWVIKDNVAAREAYERMRFAPTGEEQPLPDGSGRVEVRMRCSKAEWFMPAAVSPALIEASVATG